MDSISPDERGNAYPTNEQKSKPWLAVADTVSTYLRLDGQGYRATSIVVYQHVQALAKVNGDLGRMGGLLKLWLTDDAKLAPYDMATMSKAIVGALE